jgi:hypothetical protein
MGLILIKEAFRMMANFFGVRLLVILLSFLGIVAGIALLVLIFMILIRANKLLRLKIEQEETNEPPQMPMQ